MKYLFVLICTLSAISSSAQKPFEKDKKWGISRDGDGGEKDSIIFRAEFDEIISLASGDAGALYCGLRHEEWQTLTPNKLLNQQRYETINLVSINDNYAVGWREGYIDVISITELDFVIRGVAADAITNINIMKEGAKILMTQKGKDQFGVIDCIQKKELLKAEFEQVRANNSPDVTASFLGYKEESNFVYTSQGELAFKLSTKQLVTAVSEYEEISNCWSVTCESNKGETKGFYDGNKKWLIQPEYSQVQPLDNTSDAIAVTDLKGGMGLFFNGKQILECEFLSVVISDRRGFLAIVTTKKGTFYVTPEGKLHQPQNH